MGFNSVFKGLNTLMKKERRTGRSKEVGVAMNIDGVNYDRHVFISRRKEFGKINNLSEPWQALQCFDTSNEDI
jgi:hypothetical protein